MLVGGCRDVVAELIVLNVALRVAVPPVAGTVRLDEHDKRFPPARSPRTWKLPEREMQPPGSAPTPGLTCARQAG